MNTNLHALIKDRFAAAVTSVAGESRDPLVKPSGDPKFGDYQCNAAMGLAKQLKLKPRDVAQQIVDAVQIDDLAEPLEIAGPGFINIHLKAECLTGILAEAVQPAEHAEDRLGIAPVAQPQTIVIDYSSPNIAKQMHVGHLRTTIIGDVFARVLGFFGHHVIRQNHVGDWGTQFGMLITWYSEHDLPSPDRSDLLDRLEYDYRTAQSQFKTNKAFQDASRAAVGRLQSGDPQALELWEKLCALSRSAFQRVYKRLGVLLTDDDVRGESFYNPMLADTVKLLKRRLESGDVSAAHMKQDQGAECIFLYDDKGESLYKNPDGDPLPMIVQKSDGAFLYATTDLAALRYRCETLSADRIIYVTDARQKMHFEMLFLAGRAAGIVPTSTRLDHVTFGSVLGEDRKPMKTRSGDNIKLEQLLDEAESRAFKILEVRATAAAADDNPDQPEYSTGGGPTDHIAVATMSPPTEPIDDEAPTVYEWVNELRNLHGNEAKLAAQQELLTFTAITDELEAEFPAANFTDSTTLMELLQYLHRSTTGQQPISKFKAQSPDAASIDVAKTASSSVSQETASVLGIGAIKYADLRNDRNTDYVFDWDKLISFQGNTAPYMQYAYARVRSIYRKAAEKTGATAHEQVKRAHVQLAAPEERALAIRLTRFRETLDALADDLLPHVLCSYLFELAGDFMRFYEACSVLDAETETLRHSRMALCDLTARTLKLGLGLLGIETVERM